MRVGGEGGVRVEGEKNECYETFSFSPIHLSIIKILIMVNCFSFFLLNLHMPNSQAHPHQFLYPHHKNLSHDLVKCCYLSITILIFCI